MCIYMAGVDVHSADVSERERFAFSEEQVRHILQELVQKDGISGAVLLATCNRTELYLSVQSDRERTENNAAERQPAEQISPAQLLQYYAGSSGRTAAHPGANRTGRSAAPHGGCLRSAFPDPA